MGFAARRSYASAIFGVVILSVCPSVCPSHTRALWLIQRTYRRYFYTIWKGNPCSQMRFFVQLCSSWQHFKWLKASRGLSAIAELLVWVIEKIIVWRFWTTAYITLYAIQIYTVNHRKRGSLFLTITLANLNRFLQFLYYFNREEILHATVVKFTTSP